jgi:hypothetical protein
MEQYDSYLFVAFSLLLSIVATLALLVQASRLTVQGLVAGTAGALLGLYPLSATLLLLVLWGFGGAAP